MAYKIKKLEWHLVRRHSCRRATALGMEWEIPEYDSRLAQRKDVAQLEFEARMEKFLEDVKPEPKLRSDTEEVSKRYKDAWERVFGITSVFTVIDVAEGNTTAPLPLPHVMKDMGIYARGTPPIIHVDDKGVATVVTPTAKDRVVDHLIQEHAEISKQHTKAIHAGQHGISPGLRERLKSIETSLAIAVKDADISPANEQKESGK